MRRGAIGKFDAQNDSSILGMLQFFTRNRKDFNRSMLRIISIPVASELILGEIRRRQCRFPTINDGRETALPSPLYHSGAAGIDIKYDRLIG